MITSETVSVHTDLEGFEMQTKSQKEIIHHYTRAVCKVHVLTLLPQVRTLWRCGDRLFFKVSPLARDVILTILH
jgi:hypothetical protein